MRRPVTMLAIAAVTALCVYACGSTIRTGKTSLVTITIGGDSRTAMLHVEKATAWARLKRVLADLKLVPEANAYIPSVVQRIVVTVSADDMPTVTGAADIKPVDSTASLLIEVPNGRGRRFLVEGYRGVNNAVYYRGAVTTDLKGGEVALPVAMNVVGPGLYVDAATGIDAAATTGTSTDPFKTIVYALSRSTGTDAIFVSAGTYTSVGTSYQLKPGTALICTAPNLGAVIDFGATTGIAAIWGAEGASVDNCRIIVGQSGKGIDDRLGGTTLLATGMRINACQIDLPLTTLMIGTDLYSGTQVLESVFTGAGATSQSIGIRINSGSPVVQNSILSGLYTGIALVAGTLQITGSSIHHNDVGIEAGAGAGSSTIQQNSIFCSAKADLFSTATTTLDVRNNAWDHDSATVPPGPTGQISMNGRWDCGSDTGVLGTDICSQNGPTPVYQPSNTAAAGGCLP